MVEKRPVLPGARISIDWLVAAALALLVVATRLPYRTSMLYNWDSANFALGTRYFDVRVHAPHPPGYFFYVAVANLLNKIAGEANASLVALSIAFSVGAVVAVYALGKIMFGRRAGLIAALLLTFSVTFWTYGELALAYPSLAFFSTLAAIFAWRIVTSGDREPRLAFLMSVAYVIGSGFRPDLLLFLGPLWLWCIWLQRWRARLLCALAALAGFALWYVPTALLSGGFAEYHAVLLAYIGTDVAARYSSTNKGWAGLVVNVRDTVSYVFYALYAAALPLVAGGLWLLVRHRIWLQPARLKTVGFLLVWVAPMLAFYTFIHIGDPGYVFTFLPAIVVLLGGFLAGRHEDGLNTEAPRSKGVVGTLTLPSPFGRGRTACSEDKGEWRPSSRGRGRTVCSQVEGEGPSSLSLWERVRVRASAAGSLVATAVVLANIGVFLFHPRPMTAQGLRQNDRDYREKIEFIQTQVDPRSTILLSYDSYKHLLYYLPAYSQSIWVDVFADGGGQVRIPAGVKSILLVDARLAAINRSQPRATEVKLPSGGRMYLLAATEGQLLIVGGKAIEVGG